MESITNEQTLEVHPDLKEEWDKIKITDGKQLASKISREVYGASVVEGNFIEQHGLVNGFAEACRIAYQYHIPLLLTPDAVWLAIAQGFANHVGENAEALRKKFVDFDGKKKLIVQVGETDLYKIEWAGVISEFSKQIKTNIGADIHTNLVPQFSTTQDIQKVACEVTLMDAMQSFFEYMVCCGCGISKVKLTGTIEDWNKIKEMTEKLRNYDCDWWLDALIPVLDKFIAAYNGEIDQKFWNNIYVYRAGMPSRASPTATGWITNFFPYIESQSKYKNEKMFDIFYTGEDKQKSISPKSIPDGISRAPFICINGITGESKNCTFNSGFFGIQVKDGFISPYIGWAVTPEKKRYKS